MSRTVHSWGSLAISTLDIVNPMLMKPRRLETDLERILGRNLVLKPFLILQEMSVCSPPAMLKSEFSF